TFLRGARTPTRKEPSNSDRLGLSEPLVRRAHDVRPDCPCPVGAVTRTTRKRQGQNMSSRRASVGWLRIAGVLFAGAVSCVLHAQEFPPLDPATLPAAGSDRAPGLLWSSPDLGDGPFLIESAAPEHRELKVSVIARLQ